MLSRTASVCFRCHALEAASFVLAVSGFLYDVCGFRLVALRVVGCDCSTSGVNLKGAEWRSSSFKVIVALSAVHPHVQFAHQAHVLCAGTMHEGSNSRPVLSSWKVVATLYQSMHRQLVAQSCQEEVPTPLRIADPPELRKHSSGNVSRSRCTPNIDHTQLRCLLCLHGESGVRFCICENGAHLEN